MTEELPDGWAVAKLGDLASKIGSGATPRGGSDTYKQSGTPLIRSMNVRFEGFSKDGLAFLDQWQAVALKEVTVRSGDVLLNITGASIGRVTQAPPEMDGARVNQHVCIIRPFPDIEAAYLSNYLASPDIQRIIWSEQYGVTRQALTKSQILDLDVPIAPRQEQHRILAAIRRLVERKQSATNHLSRVPAILKRFRQAVLAAACSGRLTEDWREKQATLTPVSETLDRILSLRQESSAAKKNVSPKEIETDSLPSLPDGWQYVCSDVLFSFVTSGSRGWAQYYADEGPIFLRIGNLDHGATELDLFDIQRVQPPDGMEQKRTAVNANDILISITADVGMIGLVPTDFGQAHINQHIALARPVESWYSRYLAWYLASESAQKQFLALQRGATKVGLGLDDIKSVAIPFPSMQEQHEIVQRLESLLRTADQIETRVTASSKVCDKLTQSILAKAFRGELVRTEAELARRECREYEPASVLLERIKKEKSSAESRKTELKSRRSPQRRGKAVSAP